MCVATFHSEFSYNKLNLYHTVRTKYFQENKTWLQNRNMEIIGQNNLHSYSLKSSSVLKCQKILFSYLIMCGTETLEFSSNTLVIKPLHRILSMHWDREQRNTRLSQFSLIPHLGSGIWVTWLLLVVYNPFALSAADPPALRHTLSSYLADVAGPRSLFLARRSQEDNREALTVRRFHHNFKLQMVEALTCCVVYKMNTQAHSSVNWHWTGNKRQAQVGFGIQLLTVLITGIQFFNESTLDQRQRSSLLLVWKNKNNLSEHGIMLHDEILWFRHRNKMLSSLL